MNKRFWLGLAVSLGTVTALSEAPAYGADPTFRADELAAILAPMQGATRGLTPGSGPGPGDPGSGVVPDLKVTFEFDSADLTPEAQAQLDELAGAMQTDLLRPYRFKIAGHTDSVGSAQYNEWLSQMRASSVVSYLAETHGIESERLQGVGLGENEPADPADTKSWINRRVEVRTLDE